MYSAGLFPLFGLIYADMWYAKECELLTDCHKTNTQGFGRIITLFSVLGYSLSMILGIANVRDIAIYYSTL